MSVKTTKKPLVTIIILLLVTLIGVGGFITYQLVSKDKPVQEESGLFSTIEQDPNVVLVEGGKSIDEQLADIQKQVDEGHISLNMNVTMTVKENSNMGDIYLENPAANRYDMFVTVFLDKTQSKIGQTGVIPRGNAIKSMKLDTNLTKGIHPATITYNLINEEKQVVEQASVGIEIIVE